MPANTPPTPDQLGLARVLQTMTDGRAAGYIMHERELNYPISFDEDDAPTNATDDEDDDVVLRDSALN